MKNEKVCIYRDDAAIISHRKRLEYLLPLYQELIRLYFGLKLSRHSRVIPLIVKNAFQEVREQVRRNLPPSLRNGKDSEEMKLDGEESFFAFMAKMRKEGNLDNPECFSITGSGDVEINQQALSQFEEQHSIWIVDLKGKELLEKVIQALNDFEEYSSRTYKGISLVSVAFDGGIFLNPKWRLCDRDKRSGKLALNLNTLAVFESNRKN
jgi:hypothetical protein